MTTEERLVKLEAENKSIFHQIEELKVSVADIHKIATSIEVIAHENKNISEKVDKIDDRLNEIERQPAERAESVRRLVISVIVTGVLSALVGAVMAVIPK